jgi:hypothetical protein
MHIRPDARAKNGCHEEEMKSSFDLGIGTPHIRSPRQACTITTFIAPVPKKNETEAGSFSN